MELVNMNLDGFSLELASGSPAPGGGSVSALAAALGAALTAMVCSLTSDSRKYAAFREEAETIREQAMALRTQLLKAVDRDTEAFLLISRAYSMPKETAEEKKLRSAAIQEGLLACIESPLSIMETSLKALHLAEGLLQGFNRSAASDLGVSVLMLKAGLQGAWLNVRINLGSLKDPEAREAFSERARLILEEALPLSERMLDEIGRAF